MIVFARLCLLAALAVGATGTPAFAIPSPELVVGSLTSLSQLAALGSALIGGGAVALGTRMGGAAVSRLKRMAALFGGLAIGLFALNIYQWQSHRGAERARLEATLVRPTVRSSSGTTLDPLLKEIPYSKQLSHPLGLSTEAAAPIIRDLAAGRATPWLILDIRETAETEMGSFSNAKAVRFPDIASSNVALSGKTALLICHNGNRSAETCAALAAKGIDCRFMIGGLEKWITEGRRIGNAPVRTLGEIRAIPDYPNHRVLLNTAEARALAEDQGALFVDVRYPGEFAAGHLPDAVNLPIRPTPTEALHSKLGALPARPIIAPCYDRRSCFFAQILGLEVSRAGGDFRGRYTTPWEYFSPPQPPPYVGAYLADQNKGLWQKLREALQDQLSAGAKFAGLPLALFFLALLSRLLVLPFSLKAERDQMVARLIAPDLARIKATINDDPARRTRAIRALYRAHRLTPGRNLLALLFLPVLALSIEAVVHVAQGERTSLFWIASLAETDPLYILPVLFSLLLCVYVDWALVSTARQRAGVWLGLAPLLLLAGAMLPAAADLYVIFSALLLLLQRAAVTGLPRRTLVAIVRWVRSRRDLGLARHGIFSLDERAALIAAGNKAFRLSLMREAGLPVPSGYVLTDAFLSRWGDLSERARRTLLNRIARRMGGRSFAVRSSGEGEDGAEASFAGVFESVLDVDRKGLAAAVGRVLASFASERAQSYGELGPGRNILIQPMVAAEFSGVLFTRAPDAPGAMLIEAVRGSGEALVSGRATPFSFKIGRRSGEHLSGTAPPIDVTPLVTLARAIENLFGVAQDIEWVAAGGAFHIVQARDITTMATGEALFEEWRRLSDLVTLGAPDETVLVQTPMCELLPRPTPASLSLLNNLWASGGSADLALRGLGLAANFNENGRPLYVSAGGLLYADAREELARRPEITRLSLRRIRRMADDLAADFEARVIAECEEHLRYLEAADYSRLPLARLVHLIGEMRERFVKRTYVEAETINIAAQIFADDMRAAFKTAGYDPLGYLGGQHDTRLLRDLRKAATLTGSARSDALKEAIGHRAHFDYELAEPRYGEDAEALETLAATLLGGAHLGPEDQDALNRLPRKLVRLLARARRFEALKENAKNLSLRELAHLRYAVRAAGEKAGLGDDIFQLSLDEVASLDGPSAARLRIIVQERRVAGTALQRSTLPRGNLTARAIEAGPSLELEAAGSARDLQGTRVSGREAVTGRARVLSRQDGETGARIAGFRAGDILVAPMLHPAWLAELVIAGGAVTEIGGWLSHMAIVARERGVAMITGVPSVSAIADGTLITLESDGSITLHQEVLRPAMAAE